jgi:argininosuccinate lyase
MMKSLPLSYNRDMQEDKAALFQTVDTLKECIEIYVKMLPELKINQEVMKGAATKGFLNATDMADYLVAKGMPFRQAHGCVGEAVAYALSKKKELHELTLKELKNFSSHIKKDIFKILTTDQVINRRKSGGGTALMCVKTAITEAEKALKEKME